LHNLFAIFFDVVYI